MNNVDEFYKKNNELRECLNCLSGILFMMQKNHGRGCVNESMDSLIQKAFDYKDKLCMLGNDIIKIFNEIIQLDVVDNVDNSAEYYSCDGEFQAQNNVLVAEDDVLCSKAIVEMLELNGYKTHVAYNGVDAVDMFRQSDEWNYKAVLLDCNMPRMNGYDAARTIRRLEREDAVSVPIFVCTGDARENHISMVKKCGANDCLIKPVEFGTLVEKIRGL